MSDSSVAGKAIDTKLVLRLLRYVKPYRFQFAIALGLTILLALVAPVVPFLVQITLDTYVAVGDVGGLRMMVLAILGVLAVRTVVMYANTYMTNWLGQSIIRDIRKQVFRHILALRLGFFDRTPIGMLQTRTINDVEVLNNVFTSGLVRILGEMLQLVAILVAMLVMNWSLTLVVLVTMPLMLLATYVFKNKIQTAFRNVRKSVSEMNAFLQEHITGMQIIHIFNREKIEHDKFNVINKNLRTAHIKTVLYFSIYFPVMEIIISLSMGLLIWYGAGNVMEGIVSAGDLVAFIMYTQMFFRPLRQLADQFNMLQMGMVSAERIFNILDTDETIPNEGTLTALPEVDEKLSIQFDNVSFAYKNEDWVLQDINLNVSMGEKVALVGSTGSGKTTIINLLSRFYEIQKGEIQINGENMLAYDKDFLRTLIGVVLQDVFLFSGSIHDNITLNNPDIPAEKVIEAAKQVGAHDFISRLPGGYDYNVRERGATLSLGQRQLIAFARVMTYDPHILVLDEATANIDTESEEIIQRAIDTVMAGRTSIIIAHRLSTIQKADKIVVLKKGRIIEIGAHDELLKQEGAYYQLHQMQYAAT